MSAGSILRKWSRRAGAFVALAFFAVSARAEFRANTDIAGLQGAPNTSGILYDGSSATLCQRRLDAERAYGRTWLANPSNFGPNLTLSSSSSGTVCTLQDTRSTPPATVTVTYSSAAYRCGPEAGFITLPRAACTSCTSGYTLTGGQCNLPTACDAGRVLRRGKLAGFTGQPTGCFNGCVVNRSQASEPSWGVAQVAGDGTIYVEGSTGSVWTATGAMCAGSEPPLSDQSATLANGENYAVLQTQGENCGIFNGESVCLGSGPPANACVTTASGQAFCSQSAAAPPVPVRAGTGTPNVPAQPAAPVGTVSIRDASGNTTTYNYYNAQASQQPPLGGSTGGQTTGGTGTGGTTSGGTGGTTGGLCGLPGQALCGVDVDETGVPSMAPEDLFPDGTAEADAKAAATAVNQGIAADAADQTNAASAGLFDMLAGMVGGASGGNQCLTVPYGFTAPPPWNVQVSGQFPTEQGCQLFQLARVAFSWLLAGFTVLSSVRRVRAAFLGAPL